MLHCRSPCCASRDNLAQALCRTVPSCGRLSSHGQFGAAASRQHVSMQHRMFLVDGKYGIARLVQLALARSFRVPPLQAAAQRQEESIEAQASKRCGGCKLHFNAPYFKRLAASPDGLHLLCRGCTAAEHEQHSPWKPRPGEPDSAAAFRYPPTNQPRTCRQCQLHLAATHFPIDSRLTTGRRATCRACEAAATAKRSAAQPESLQVMSKVCHTCEQVLPAARFSRHSRSLGGLRGVCKECQSRRETAWRNRRRILHVCVERQRCCSCDQVKDAAAFSRDRLKVSGLAGICKKCQAIYHREWRASRQSAAVEQPS